MIRTYYCISCKKNFDAEAKEKNIKQKCPFCTSQVYVRDVTRYPKQKVNREKQVQTLLRKIKTLQLVIEKRKFQLVYEHNLVESMKKYVPNKEEFNECLKLAKRQTQEVKHSTYKTLKKYKVIKKEDDIGFTFQGVKR